MGWLTDVLGTAVSAYRTSVNEDKKEESLRQRYAQEFQYLEHRYIKFMSIEREKYRNDRLSFDITSRWKQALDARQTNNGLPDFSCFDNLSASQRDTPKFQNDLWGYLNATYKNAVQGFFNGIQTPGTMMVMLKPYEYFRECAENVHHSITHWSYFVECRNEIKSILSDAKDISTFLKGIEGGEAGNAAEYIGDLNLFSWVPSREGLNEIFTIADSVPGVAPTPKELFEAGKYQEAFDAIVCANRSEEELKLLKLSMLVVAYQDSETQTTTDAFDLIKRTCEAAFRGLVVIEDSSGRQSLKAIPPIDVIIAESIRLHRAGSIASIDNRLHEYLNDLCRQRTAVAIEISEQYGLLAEVFAYLKAYKQESMVLESMVVNNIPRTKQQEARLSFLRNGGTEKARLFAPVELDCTESKNILAFDYRSLGWNEAQLASYFDMMSGENKTPKTPLVVAEWIKSIEAYGVDWDIEQIKNLVSEALDSVLGNRLDTILMDAGIILEGDTEYSPAIVILERGDGKYPWLGFILMGERMTLKQIALSIYAIYIPEKDHVDVESVFEKNAKLQDRMVLLTKKQNPRINNYINTVEGLLVESMERWLNQNNDADIY